MIVVDRKRNFVINFDNFWQVYFESKEKKCYIFPTPYDDTKYCFEYTYEVNDLMNKFAKKEDHFNLNMDIEVFNV